MRISLRGLADLTNVNSMLLPAFGPNLPATPTYSGGISGLGQTPDCDTDPGGELCDLELAQAGTTPVTAPAGTVTTVSTFDTTTQSGCVASGGSWNSITGCTTPATSSGITYSTTTQATCIAPGDVWTGSACVQSSAVGTLSTSSLLYWGIGIVAVVALLMAVKK